MFAKLKVYLIMFTAFVAFAGLAYWYYLDTQKALRQYAENPRQTGRCNSNQAEANAALAKDSANMQIAFNTLTEES